MNSRRPSVILCLFVVVSLFHVVVTVLPPNVMAGTLYVGGAGSGNYTMITEAIDDANPGDTVFVYGGTYFENIVISKSISLVGEDKDTTTINGSYQGDTISVTADYVNISGFTLTGGGRNPQDSGVRLDEATNCHITNSRILFNDQYGILLRNSDENTFDNITVSDNRFGIEVMDSWNNTFRDNTITSNLMGLEMRFSDNSIIQGNVVSNNMVGIDIYNSTWMSISNNSVSDSEDGILIIASPNALVIDNVLDSNDNGIRLFESPSSTVLRNSMAECGIAITGDRESWDTHVIDDTNEVNGKPVLYLKDDSGSRINGSDYGQIIIVGSNGIHVEDSLITNTSVAVQVGFSSNIYILNNTFSGNKEHGVAAESIKYSYINDNTITSNGRYGIIILRSDENKIARNHFIQNGVLGAGVYMGEKNLIFHNNFIENDWQADNRGVTHSWDLGYPSGGNYWSDYFHNDTFKGENQDQPGSDGIGDEQYDLQDYTGVDRYPLMSPFVTPPSEIGSPECQIDSPAQDAKVEGVVEISGTASDTDGTVEKVEIRIGDNPWIEVEGTTTWTYEFDSVEYSNGDYHILVRSFDGEKYSMEASRTVTIDNPRTGDLGQILLWALLAIVIVVSLVFAYVYISRYREYKREKESEEEGYSIRLKK